MSIMTDQDRILLKTLVAMAWADGELNPNECGWLDQVFEHLALPEEERQQLMDTPQSLPSAADYSSALSSEEDREFLVKVLLTMASSDGSICKDEQSMLEEVGARLGISSDRIKDLKLQAVG